jgi:alpha-glucosidase (family GH31 glycosyl hydrolase)
MVNIIHTPYGLEHPYEQLPEERFPRQPLANEPFTVGMVTRPAGAVSSLRVHYCLGDSSEVTIEAQEQHDWQQKQEVGVGAEFLERLIRIEQDVWQAQLTAPPMGETLTYWIEADGVSTERFTLRGEAWEAQGSYIYVDGWLTVRSSSEFGSTRHLPNLQQIEWLSNGESKRRVRLTFNVIANERFFGLGERFNALNQRGNIMDVRCYEQYKNHGRRTYMPIPFLLSSAGYGVYVESNRWMQFDLAATSDDRWVLEADAGEDETLRLCWFTGDDPLQIISQFTRMTGPSKLPPKWSFGLWMSGNEWNSQAKIEQEVNTSLKHGIQPSVVVIEAWSDETTFYIWNDAQYTAQAGSIALHYSDFTFPADGKWRDPKAMVDWLHKQGIRVLLWQIPVMKILELPHTQHEADRTYFEQAGFGVHEADGSLHKVRPFWFRGGYLWDVTNPLERDWWLNKRAYLLDEVGIDGFKTDGGEHLWGSDTRFKDGRTGAELWNEYPHLYTQAYYDFANQKKEAITFSRAGFIGSQRSPLHWAGDENSTWEAFQHSILAGLSAGISGISFWGWDFGGFSGKLPSVELYLRTAAMAIFCPVFQYHSEFNQHRQPSHDRTPWNIQAYSGDTRVLPIFKHLMSVRQQLMPYIWQEAQHSASTGEPMMRALQLWSPKASPYQYFFGRDLLICPIVEAGINHARVYLPLGEWRDLWTEVLYTGDTMVQVDVPLEHIPVFVRTGSSISLQQVR